MIAKSSYEEFWVNRDFISRLGDNEQITDAAVEAYTLTGGENATEDIIGTVEVEENGTVKCLLKGGEPQRMYILVFKVVTDANEKFESISLLRIRGW